MTKRIFISMSDETGQKVADWAKRLGVSQSQLASMSMQAGLGAILRTVAPEEAISPEIWARILMAGQQIGLDLQDVDIEKIKVKQPL